MRFVESLKTLTELKKALRECKKALMFNRMDQMYRPTYHPSLTNFAIISLKCDICYLKSRIDDFKLGSIINDHNT